MIGVVGAIPARLPSLVSSIKSGSAGILGLVDSVDLGDAPRDWSLSLFFCSRFGAAADTERKLNALLVFDEGVVVVVESSIETDAGGPEDNEEIGEEVKEDE